MCSPYLEKLKPTFLPWFIKRTAVYIWLQLCQILTDFNNFCTAETGKKMYKTWHTTTESRTSTSCASVWSPYGANWTNLLWTTPSTSGGIVCRLVSTLKADIFNITYDCYCQIIMLKWQQCKFDNWRWLSVLFCCERKWTKNNSVLTEKCSFTK